MASPRARVETYQQFLWDAAGTDVVAREVVVRRSMRSAPAPVSPAPEPAESVPTVAPGGPIDFVVLSSSSGGNCSVLISGEGSVRRVTLIDAGLSPLRTRKLLGEFGLTLEHIDDVLFTHLDHDHCHDSWPRHLPRHARFRVFAGHRGRARNAGLLRRKTLIFEHEAFDLPCGVRVTPTRQAHDQLGVVVFRFDAPGASLGYATDVGRTTPAMIEALAGVDVLAIESNYCPRMQVASNRPEFLKKRIMGGAGHLSNEECRAAVAAIAPRREVVLLHLSRDCNAPDHAASLHAGEGYRVTVARHDGPTAPIRVCDGVPSAEAGVCSDNDRVPEFG
jgi:phosphoribosyl 1,2-cyclic phosphodiesterase